MAEAGCDCVVMEVSSQGLMLHRTAGIPFEIGIFTNLGKDHIGPNEHKDFEDYKDAKACCFSSAGWESRMWMINISKMFSEMPPAGWRPSVSLKMPTCGRKM